MYIFYFSSKFLNDFYNTHASYKTRKSICDESIYVIELRPIFGNPGHWLCETVIIHEMEIHLFNVLNSVSLTMETVRICHMRELNGKYKIKCCIK